MSLPERTKAMIFQKSMELFVLSMNIFSVNFFHEDKKDLVLNITLLLIILPTLQLTE